MNRRRCLKVLGLAGLCLDRGLLAAQIDSGTVGLRSLAVLEVELVDEQDNPLQKAAQERRLRDAARQLRHELTERRLYRVVDAQPSLSLQAAFRSEQAYLYRCVDCAEKVGRQLKVDLVMTPWVQKVSELILNFNVRIHQVASGRAILSKSVDMRGNQDETWIRAIRFLARDMAEKRAQDSGYGQ